MNLLVHRACHSIECFLFFIFSWDVWAPQLEPRSTFLTVAQHGTFHSHLSLRNTAQPIAQVSFTQCCLNYARPSSTARKRVLLFYFAAMPDLVWTQPKYHTYAVRTLHVILDCRGARCILIAPAPSVRRPVCPFYRNGLHYGSLSKFDANSLRWRERRAMARHHMPHYSHANLTMRSLELMETNGDKKSGLPQSCNPSLSLQPDSFLLQFLFLFRGNGWKETLQINTISWNCPVKTLIRWFFFLSFSPMPLKEVDTDFPHNKMAFGAQQAHRN